jgi:FkbM family methyltransferase
MYRDSRDHRKAIREYWQLSSEDRARRDLFSQFIGRGDLVFDVGANHGLYSKVFLALGARVIAVEPQASCVAHIRRYFEGKKGFELVTEGLAAMPGTAEMIVSNATGLSSLSAEHIEKTKGRFASHIDWQGRQKVTLTTLEHLIARYGEPHFIKIDVEGFELEVLRGLRRPVKFISIEFTAECVNHTMTALDYMEALSPIEGQILFDDSMAWKLRDWQNTDQLKDSLRTLVDEYPLCIGDVYIRQRR